MKHGSFLFCPQGSHMAMWDDQRAYAAGLVRFLRESTPVRQRSRSRLRSRRVDAKPPGVVSGCRRPLPPAAERVTVTVLATTDMHGYLYPYDYFTRQPSARGLAAAATLIAEVRRETPHTLLVDCGDTIQGSPLAAVYQAARRSGEPGAPEPMMLAMNRVGYDAMAVGNHEFNFGLEESGRGAGGRPLPVALGQHGDGRQHARVRSLPLKTVGGVKVAVIGLTTPAVPQWEKPENIRRPLLARARGGRAARARGARGREARRDARRHALGAGAGAGGGRRASSFELPGENAARAIAERFPALAAVIYGHSHRATRGAASAACCWSSRRTGRWTSRASTSPWSASRAAACGCSSAASRLIPVTPETQPDPEILELARPYHEAAERQLDSPVTESRTALSGARGRFEDSALVDAIHEVQLHYTKADVSFAALFQTRVEFPRGPVTRRELAALYLYDNELYAVEGSGRTVREALENASRYFRTCPDPSCETGPLVDRGVAGFNYETAQGVEYAIDLRRPLGARVVDLRYRGRPLRDDERLRIAINSYRAGGSAGYSMFKGARIVFRSGREIRDLMADYFGGGRPLPERADGNWRLLPERAVSTLLREVDEWR